MSSIIGSINILDIIIVALTIMLLLFGIWRGMFKMIYGLISSILALVLAIVLISPVVTFTIDNTLIDDKVVEIIAQPLDNYVPNSQKMVDFYDLDNNPETPEVLGFTEGTEVKPFEEIFEGSRMRFVASPIETLVEKQVSEYGESPLLEAMVAVLTGYLLSGAAFIILWLLMFIIIKIIFNIFKKLVTTTYIGYYLNKVLGGVLGLVISGVLVFGFMTIVRLMGNYEVIIPINRMIEDSTISKLVAENNYLYDFIANKVDIQSIIDKIMAMINKVGI